MENSKREEEYFTIEVKAIPGSSKNSIQHRPENSLTIHISAPPEKNKANNELIKLIANWLKISKKEVSLVKGETSREKLIQLPIRYQNLFYSKIEELKNIKEWRG